MIEAEAVSTGSPAPTNLLVTGCYRSGTTLVEKLLNMHPQVLVASQPFPALYILVKERFLESRGLQRRYPLDHLFRQEGYPRATFDDFLRTVRLDADFLSSFFDRMDADRLGLWTREMLRFRDRIKPGSFVEVLDQLNACVGAVYPRESLRYRGGKEVLIEEFVPFLLGRGTRVVLVIRDPRAMVASLNFRDRDNLTGENRPILYSLRAWRKSVAFGTVVDGSSDGRLISYEGLVNDQDSTLRALTDWLDLTPYAADRFDGGILDQHGAVWKGNSSYSDRLGVSGASLRSFEERLPRDVLAFIEAVCEPEMKLLNYEPLSTPGERMEALDAYCDPFTRIHASFPANYSSDPRRLSDERRRLQLLRTASDELSDEAALTWFVSTEAYRALRRISVTSV